MFSKCRTLIDTKETQAVGTFFASLFSSVENVNIQANVSSVTIINTVFQMYVFCQLYVFILPDLQFLKTPKITKLMKLFWKCAYCQKYFY